MSLRLYLFGTFRVECDGRPIQLPRRKTEALLAYLALHPHAQARERIAALFWGDKRAVAMGTGNLARVLFTQQNWDQARGILEQACALFRELNDRLNLAEACYDLGYVALKQNDAPLAAQLYDEGITASRAIGAPVSVLAGLKRAANLALAQNDPTRTVRLLAHIQRASHEINMPTSTFEHKLFENDLAQARAQLDTDGFATAWLAGEAMSMEQAIKEAMGMP